MCTPVHVHPCSMLSTYVVRLHRRPTQPSASRALSVVLCPQGTSRKWNWKVLYAREGDGLIDRSLPLRYHRMNGSKARRLSYT